MKVGDIVIRRIPGGAHPLIPAAREQKARLGMGLVLSKHMSGFPAHPCIRVFYPKISKIYDIAESLMEVISEEE